MDPILLTTTAVAAATAVTTVPTWVLLWRARHRKALGRGDAVAGDLGMSPLAQAELREATERAPGAVPGLGDAGKVPEFPLLPAAAILDGIAIVYGRWIQSGSVGVLGEEVSRGVTHALVDLDNLFGTHLEVAGRALQDAASVAHHILDPTLSQWFEQIGGAHFVHLVAQKFAAIDAMFQGEGLFEIGGQSISAAIPWATLIVSSAKQAWLLAGGKTTVLRAIGHISLDTAMVAGGVMLGTIVAGLVGAALVALDVTVTYGAAHALAGIFGVAGGFAGAKVAGEIKGAKLEALCKELAELITEFDALCARLQAALEPRLQSVVAELNAALRGGSRAVRTGFEQRQQQLIADHDRQLDSFAAALPVHVDTAISAARADLAAATAARRALGLRYYLDLEAGPRALAEERRCGESLSILLEAQGSLAQPAARGFEERWEVACRSAARDPFRRLWSYIQPVVEAAAQVRQDLRDAHDAALRDIRALEDELDAALEARKAVIVAEGRKQLNPIGTKLQKLLEAVEAEGAALGRKTVRA